ncbi:HEAT repeat protein [Dictyocaulus viviparus]|uniref:HEAT repeat protein n=1 Tax=Dictyocaulus viviparus TaxID=29172 RepID=A0A0D8X9B5_DICVI|nr:HEAT repeat protein [Dictyocaulus viviparus]
MLCYYALRSRTYRIASDSEDEISVSGSEAEEDDIDVEIGDEDVPASDDIDMDIGSNSSCVKWYQKEIWQLTKLPYYDDLERQANKAIANIKAGLAHAILLNDPITGLMHWVPELERYIDYHGRRLSKDDHILFIRLLNCLVTKGNTFRDVKIAMHCLNKLLSKRDFLIRGDVEIDWRPLLELYVEVSYKNLEEDGVFLMPDGFRVELQTYIAYARRYFSDNAPQQLLDEIIRSFRLGNVVGLCQQFNLEVASGFITYTMGTQCHEKLMENLSSIFRLVESYLHPSNHGMHTQHLLIFMNKLSLCVLSRVKRERMEKASNKPRTFVKIPTTMRLSQSHLDRFVTQILPCLKLAMFSKARNEFVAPIVKCCCSISPKIVLPAVLDIVYPALETLTEPHRLLQALQVLVAVAPILAKDQPDKDGKTFRVHAINLMNSLLPGLDQNDMGKCLTTFQIVGVLVNLIPLVDCSDAVHLRSDLSDDEKELCSATANFDSIIAMFMDKLLSMMVEYGEAAAFSCSHTNINAKTRANMDDHILHRGTISVFKGICRNSSTALYKVAVDRLYNFLCEHVFDSKTVSTAVADMVFVAVKMYPTLSFVRFFSLIKKKLQQCISAETYSEEKVDFQIIWWLSMADRVLKAPANYIVENWSDVRELLELVLPLKKCTLATEKSAAIMESVLESLCSIYLLESPTRRANADRSLEETLPIRYNSLRRVESCLRLNSSIDEHVPSQQDIDCAEELFRDFVLPPLQALANPYEMDKKEIMHHIILIRNAVLGASASLPFFEGPNYGLEDSPSLEAVEHPIARPVNAPILTLNGESVRDMVLKSMRTLLAYLFEYSEDDVKSIQQIAVLLNTLASCRGLNSEMFVTSVLSYRTTKAILSDQIAGNRGNIEMLSEEYILLMHKKRNVTQSGYQCKPQHIEILHMLVKIGTSTYSQNRIKAQLVLVNLLKDYPFAHKSIISELVSLLDPANNSSHEQIKGALHILTDHKRDALLLRVGFEAQLLAMPAIVAANHSEKPSIIDLLEHAQNSIVELYESYRIQYDISDEMRVIATALLDEKEACPLNASYGIPSKNAIEANANNLILLKEKLTRDMPYPEPVLRMWVRLLVHDTVKARRMATAVVASWLKLNKPKAVKREWVILNKEPNTSMGARWPIHYGIRSDNRCMMYEEERLPTTEEEWNAFQFCGKQHWGFYTWPEKLITYAPLAEQVDIDRHDADLSETELFIVETFRDREFSARLRELFAVEDSKEDSFNAVNFSLFQGLFRCFNDILCPVFKEHLEVLITSSKVSDQKLASEIVAGLINGSKLWKWGRQRKMWTWLSPLLTRALENMKEEAMRNWGVCIATVCGCSESRMLKPLLDILFALVNRPTESAFAAQSRLFLLQGGLCQFEWRTIELWNKLVSHLSKVAIVQQYANLRDRMAISLVTASWFDLPTIYYSPNIPISLHAPTIAHCIGLYDQQMGACWDETRLKDSNNCLEDSELNGSGDSEVKRAARLALKGALSFTLHVAGQSLTSIPPSILRLIPIFCHFSNDVGDEELYKQCLSLLSKLLQAAYIPNSNLSCVMQVFRQILKSSSCWWKAKVTMLWLMKGLVFSNLYVFATVKEEIGQLLTGCLSECQLEVRQTAADTLSGLIQSSFFAVTPYLVNSYSDQAKSVDVVQRHGGVLGLSAIVLAAPYTVPSYLPDVLMRLCHFASDKQPIRDTVKKTLSEFKRTHQDSWREHESQFNEDQLCALRNLFVSPNYYV